MADLRAPIRRRGETMSDHKAESTISTQAGEQGEIDLAVIGYIDEPDMDYSKGLDAARLPKDLTTLVKRFRPLFPDAYGQGANLTDEEFLQWRSGFLQERKGRFSGEKFMNRFGAVLMPANLIHIGMIAQKFGVPFGLAFCRMRDNGMIAIEDGICVLKNNEEKK